MWHSRYAELREVGKLVLGEEDLTINDDQVMVRITHCGLCQYDNSYYTGIIGSIPMRLGHEPAGVVEAVGANVTDFKPGDRVTGLFAYLRAFATYGVAEPGQLLKVPDHVPLEHALGEPLKCISTILRAAPPELGDHILVMGTGFMGLMVVAGLVGGAPASIIAADIREDRLKLAQEMGATHAVNAADPDFVKRVKAITGGRGVDIAIEVTSHPEPVELAAQCLRKTRARYVLAGWHGLPGTYTLRNWTTVGAIILTPHPSYSLDPFDDMRRGLDGVARGVFPMDKIITHRFTLEEINHGFDMLRTGEGGYIKGVLMP
jgi:threonine dehydrogenase-like Zn-dependent dehydrogenase